MAMAVVSAAAADRNALRAVIRAASLLRSPIGRQRDARAHVNLSEL